MAPARSESVCKSRSGMSIGRDCFRQQAIDPDFTQYTNPRDVLTLRQPLHGVVEELSPGFQDSLQCLLDRPAATETVYPHLAALADPYQESAPQQDSSRYTSGWTGRARCGDEHEYRAPAVRNGAQGRREGPRYPAGPMWVYPTGEPTRTEDPGHADPFQPRRDGRKAQARRSGHSRRRARRAALFQAGVHVLAHRLRLLRLQPVPVPDRGGRRWRDPAHAAPGSPPGAVYLEHRGHPHLEGHRGHEPRPRSAGAARRAGARPRQARGGVRLLRAQGARLAPDGSGARRALRAH